MWAVFRTVMLRKAMNIFYSPRMVEEIKEEKNGTSNKQTVIAMPAGGVC